VNKFFISCAGICLILGIIAFGYLFYQLIGYWTTLLTVVFAGASIIGINIAIQEGKQK